MKLSLVLMFCALFSIAVEATPRASHSSDRTIPRLKGGPGDGPQPLPIGESRPLFFGPGDGPMPIKPVVHILGPELTRRASHCAYPTR